MCKFCGGGKSPKGAPGAKGKTAVPRNVATLVRMVYVGPRPSAFELLGGVTRARYCVPAEEPRLVCLVGSSVPGVQPADVAWFRSVARGAHFILAPSVVPEEIHAEPEPEPEAERMAPEPEAEGES
jgi:hypothetical protein